MDLIQKGIAVSAISLAVVAAAPTVGSAGTLGLDFSPGNVGSVGSSVHTWTLGYAFQDVTATSVIALGSWDNDGIDSTIDVGLWNSQGTLLASATVNGAQTPIGSAPWIFTAISPVALTPGDTYYVGSYGITSYAFQVNPVTIAPQISYLHNAWVSGGLSFPTLVSPTGEEHAFYGGNVELGTAAVPEPAALAILGAGLVGLSAVRRRRRR
jgi:hypothetical protein